MQADKLRPDPELPQRVLAALEKYGGWQETLDHIARLEALAEGAEADRADAEANHRRYQWAANELLACDYGDNDRGEVGWIVYGWRDLRGGMGRRIYGPTIDAAIDAALAGAVTQGEG